VGNGFGNGKLGDQFTLTLKRFEASMMNDNVLEVQIFGELEEGKWRYYNEASRRWRSQPCKPRPK
jgi:hypothetical protein